MTMSLGKFKKLHYERLNVNYWTDKIEKMIDKALEDFAVSSNSAQKQIRYENSGLIISWPEYKSRKNATKLGKIMQRIPSALDDDEPIAIRDDVRMQVMQDYANQGWQISWNRKNDAASVNAYVLQINDKANAAMGPQTQIIDNF